MKAYIANLFLRIKVGLTYRFAAIAGTITQFFWALLFLMIYDACYKSGANLPMPWEQLASFIWIQQAFFMLTVMYSPEPEIYDSITTGQIAYELVRPISIYWFWFSKIIASKLSSAIPRSIPILIIASFLPIKYAMRLPESFAVFGLFLITLLIGLVLTAALQMIFYGIMFFVVNGKGLFKSFGLIGGFFAGSEIPIPFFPPVLKTIAYILPFRLCTDLPFRIYSGNIGIAEGLQGIVIQAIWILVTVLIGELIMHKATSRVVVQGG